MSHHMAGHGVIYVADHAGTPWPVMAVKSVHGANMADHGVILQLLIQLNMESKYSQSWSNTTAAYTGGK